MSVSPPLWGAPPVQVPAWKLPDVPNDLSVGRSAFLNEDEQWVASRKAVWCAYCGYWVVKGGYSDKEWGKAWLKKRVVCARCRALGRGDHHYHYLRGDAGYDALADAASNGGLLDKEL